MNDHEPNDLTPGERATREAVRALSHGPADDGFRARLRHEFVSGRIGRRRGLTFARPWFARPAVLLPLAAGFLAVALLVVNRGPDWRVVAADGEGQVVIGERTFALADTRGMAEQLRRGGHVQVAGNATLDLVAPGVAAVALAPDADVTLSASPNRFWRRGMAVQVAAGNAYFTTGHAFHGAHLDVRTRDATVRAVGTSFAVLCADFGTCVCVMEGQVRVGDAQAAPGEGVDVPGGMRRTFHTNGQAETAPILEDSVHRLHAQRATVGRELGR